MILAFLTFLTLVRGWLRPQPNTGQSGQVRLSPQDPAEEVYPSDALGFGSSTAKLPKDAPAHRPPLDLTQPFEAFRAASPSPEPPTTPDKGKAAAPCGGSPVSVTTTLEALVGEFEPVACDLADMRAIRAVAQRAARAHDGGSNEATFPLVEPVDVLCAQRRADETALHTEVAPGNTAWAHTDDWATAAWPGDRAKSDESSRSSESSVEPRRCIR